ncbi:MAG: hypothetical protein IJZ47_01745 [Oscillospiraceae bacterium]|nr:hypothetical protein [Oscillospiraceae bacterium]
MAKTNDITEITFEQEKKTFSWMCTALETACIVMFAAFAVTVAVVLGVVIAGGAKMNDVIVLAVNSGVLLLGMASALNYGRVIFRSLKSGETPFRYDIADKVRDASLALVICGLAGILVQAVSNSFSEAFSDICHYYFFVTVGNMFTGVLLGIMSYVMNYGCKLQQESDETL